MNRKCKFLALLLTLLMCMSVFTTFTAFATNEYDTGETIETYDTEYVEPTTEYVEPTTEYVEPETPAPTEYVEPDTDVPVTNAPDQPEEETPNDEGEGEEDGDNYNNNDNYEDRENNTTSEKAETAAIYDAEDDDVSSDTLKKSDWAKIAEQLKNSNDAETDDFAFIRNNDPNGNNNGEWMLILGIAMEALGLGIITVLIVMKVRRNKAVKASVGGRGGRGGGTPSGRTAPRSKEAQHRAQQAPRPQRISQKQRSKFDTADIAVPKHAQRSSGKRYKPKH